MRHHIRLLLILATFTTLAPSPAGCGDTHPKLRRAGDELISCAESHAGDIVAGVTAILLGGGTTWKSDLEDLGKTAGRDAFACAVKTASDALSGGQNGGKATASSPARARAAEVIGDHGWRFE